jgi:hypothetical protein
MASDVIHRYLEQGTTFHAVDTCGHWKVALEVLWAVLCISIYTQAALMFLAVNSMVGLGNKRVNKTFNI